MKKLISIFIAAIMFILASATIPAQALSRESFYNEWSDYLGLEEDEKVFLNRFIDFMGSVDFNSFDEETLTFTSEGSEIIEEMVFEDDEDHILAMGIYEELEWIYYCDYEKEEGVLRIRKSGGQPIEDGILWDDYCYEITDIIIEEGITSIPTDAFFYGYEQLSTVTLPDGLTSIGDSAFEGCNMLSSINLPKGLKSIGNRAFRGCGFSEITIPDSVTAIGSWAFAGCEKLKTFSTGNGVSIFGGGVISGCSSLENLNIGTGVTIINENFSGCSSLSQVTLPASVRRIYGSGATYKGFAQQISIPSSVTYISDDAFGGFWEQVTELSDNLIGDTNKIEMAQEKGTAKWLGSHISGWSNDIPSGTIIYEVLSYGDLEIICEKGSYAETFASEHHIPYSSTLPKSEPIAIATDNISVLVKNDPIIFDVPPVILDGTTMIPVRLALEPLGAEFEWDGGTQTVTITANGKNISLTIGAETALVDGEEKPLAKPAMIIDGRTLIPVRFVAEELGYNVEWANDTKTVIITE